MKHTLLSLAAAAAIVITPSFALAHVVVQPTQVGVGAFQTFTTSVPNEKNMAVTELRVTIPKGLNEVAPTVKPGWEVKITKSDDTVTELNWTGGSIPAGQRDDFTFSAQAPAKAATLQWKAYQTYEDGSVVAWDQKPTGGEQESDSGGPYSETKVVNDLASTPKTTENTTTSSGNGTLGLAFGLLGTVLGAAALLYKRK